MNFDYLKGLVIQIEGNIASGKSTLAKELKKLFQQSHDSKQLVCFDEPVCNPFLAAFYKDPKKYGFAFQAYMLTTRLYQMNESNRQAQQEEKTCVLDRGAVGDTVFASLNHELGSLSDEEFDIYKAICQNRAPHSLGSFVNVLVYLDVDINECYRRMKLLRQREEEVGVTVEYLDGIDKTYFHTLVNWLTGRESKQNLNFGSAPIAIVVQNNDAKQVLALIEQSLKNERKSAQLSFGSLSEAHKDFPNFIDTRDKVVLMNRALKCEVPTFKQVFIDWKMPHNYEFRRLVMKLLSYSVPVCLLE